MNFLKVDLNCLALFGIPLYVLYKSEGSLNIDKILYANAVMKKTPGDKNENKKIEMIQGGSVPSASNSSQNTPTPATEIFVYTKPTVVMKDLFIYLKKESHYKEFAQFLSECLSLVCILCLFIIHQ